MASKKNLQERVRREHGDVTRAKIIDVAGTMFAEHGFANVTAKNVCEKIGINITSANYHFGSRDGLHVAVIREAFNFVMGSDFMDKLSDFSVPPRSRLVHFIASLASLDKHCWQMKLLARESVSPSDLWVQYFNQETEARMGLLKEVFSQATGIPRNAPSFGVYYFYFFSPIVLSLIRPPFRLVPYEWVGTVEYKTVMDEMMEITLFVLDEISARYAKRKSKKQ